jgi:hypothetical protein
MIQHLQRRAWLGLFAVAWLLTPATVHAWGTPIPMKVDSIFIYRFDVKVGPSAFARPAAPWYTYFPSDPNLQAQPARNQYPNWPTNFPAAQAPSAGGPVTYQMPAQEPAAGYYYPQAVQPTGYYTPAPSYWYVR